MSSEESCKITLNHVCILIAEKKRNTARSSRPESRSMTNTKNTRHNKNVVIITSNVNVTVPDCSDD